MLLIADAFKGLWTDKAKSLIEKDNGKMVSVLHNMTNCFQLIDLTVNRSCKLFLRDKAQIWYAKQAQAKISKEITSENVYKHTQAYTRKVL